MKATPFALSIALGGSLLVAPVSAQTNRPNLDLVRQLNEAFVQVAETVSPSVVVLTITIKSTVFSESPDSIDPAQREYFRRYHRDFEDEPNQGRGSGIIIRKNGFILTNRHVVEDADTIQVRLLDGRVFDAKVQGVDEQSDIAVVKINADNLPVAKLGDSARVRVGEFAIAIGAPFGLDYSVTFGHISAKSRSNVIPFYLNGQMMDQDFFQTDASINTGNSGGPLVNIDGEVIGINTLIRGVNRGIGFAIPINFAREIADKLITDGKFSRPWLGIEIAGLKEDPEYKAAATGIDDGVLVRNILSDGPAAQSGLRTNDVILAVDGKPVSTAQQLRAEIRHKTIGQSVNLDVFRTGRKIDVKVTPAEYSTAQPPYAEEPAAPGDRSGAQKK